MATVWFISSSTIATAVKIRQGPSLHVGDSAFVESLVVSNPQRCSKERLKSRGKIHCTVFSISSAKAHSHLSRSLYSSDLGILGICRRGLDQQRSYSPALQEGEGILEQGLQAYRTSPVRTPYHLCRRRQQGG